MSRVPPLTTCSYAEDRDTYPLLVREGIATMDEEEAMIHSCYCNFKDENIIYLEFFLSRSQYLCTVYDQYSLAVIADSTLTSYQ